MQGISLKPVASADEDCITAVLKIKSSKPYLISNVQRTAELSRRVVFKAIPFLTPALVF